MSETAANATLIKPLCSAATALVNPVPGMAKSYG
jgi:hypothetical protein